MLAVDVDVGRGMEKAVDLAVRYAVDLARSRGARLASLTLRGEGHAHAVDAAARASLRRFALADPDAPEVRFIAGDGPLKLLSVELLPLS